MTTMLVGVTFNALFAIVFGIGLFGFSVVLFQAMKHTIRSPIRVGRRAADEVRLQTPQVANQRSRTGFKVAAIANAFGVAHDHR